MASDEIGLNIVKTLADYERLLSKYYEALAVACPQKQDFFIRMSKAELGHAKLVDNLAEKICSGDVRFAPGRFTIAQLKKAESIIVANMASLAGMKLAPREALARALGVEKSLIEDRFYEVVAADSSASKLFKGAMIKSIAAHVDTVEREFSDLLDANE